MKLLRYGPIGLERPGVLDRDGRVRDLSPLVADITPDVLSRDALTAIAGTTVEDLPLVDRPARLGTPVRGTSKFVAVGLNFTDHAVETGQAIPEEPVLFFKAVSCIVGPNDDIMLPRYSMKTDWEVEMGVVIGAKASYVTEEEALSYVAGYCVINDVSEREFQLERGGTWDKGKGCDTFGPMGPYLVTADEVVDPQRLHMWLDVNGQRRQTGNTSTMIFPVRTLVSYISQFMTLQPGDVITTGTPPGVGLACKPPVYLKAGDVITLGIEKLGEQRQLVVPWSRSVADTTAVEKQPGHARRG